MTERKDVLRAVLWMSGAVISFLSMAVAGRSLDARYDTFEIMLWRSITGLVIVVLVITLRGRWQEVTTRHMGLQVLRNLAHFTAQNLWFFAIAVIPLAQVFALEFTSPVWVLVLSPLILGERMTRTRILSALLGFAGILIVTRPGADSLSPGLIAAGIAAIGFAVTYITTKRLTRHSTTLCILFWMTALQSVFGLVCAGYDLQITPPDVATLPLLLLVGLAGLAAHFCVTSALRFAPATLVMPIDFTRLPLAVLIGALFLGDPFDPLVLLGAAVIFAGNYLNIWSETRRPAAPAVTGG